LAGARCAAGARLVCALSAAFLSDSSIEAPTARPSIAAKRCASASATSSDSSSFADQSGGGSGIGCRVMWPSTSRYRSRIARRMSASVGAFVR
jgi:hypothetical protein